MMTKTALAVDLFMKAGQDRLVAARSVVRELQKRGVDISEGKVSSVQTVLGWRTELAKAGRGKSPNGADWFWYGGGYVLERDELLKSVADEKLDPLVLARRQLDDITKNPRIG